MTESAEVANTLCKLHRAQQLQGVNPQELLVHAKGLVDHIEPDRQLQVEALARREAATLLTAGEVLTLVEGLDQPMSSLISHNA